ncbi:MAG TPA: F0F1 ATP synthase subunit delta [Firmicutes bacterium]|jgi:F-type H+-transporting ATPase subunit delta|nr:F0F1 ATP synthase subunit delta [Bacillota bacterium]
MRGSTVARRYANALFELAKAQGRIEAVDAELETVVQSMRATEDLRRVWEHRLIAPRRKKEVVGQVFAGQVSAEVKNFLSLLIDKHRERFLESIFASYRGLADRYRNIVEVEVRSAIALSPAEVDEVAAKLQQQLGSEVRLRTTVDQSLLGGIVIRVGDRLIDGSLRRRLQDLRSQLVRYQPSETGGSPQ